MYHPRWSPYRDMMPTYNQLAASSLLNQQYSAALGLGLSGQARRAPMVEQAVQTMPLASAAQKKGKTTTQPQNKPLVRPVQRSGQAGAQVQKENIPTSQAPSQPSAASAEGQNTGNQKQRQRQGSRRSRNRSRGQLIVKNTKASTLAFESDFDFESANAQFKDDLTKENVVEESWETQDSPPEQEEEPLRDKYYDKAKCFFDNISSDLKPRRTTWAEEKKLNMETFGVPGRFLRGRGFRGRGRRVLNATEQRALPKVGSGRV